MLESNNTLINLSFSMHSGPGTFALLLGSGISQGAGVPTGWDIVLDLIRRLATLEGETNIDDPERWFWEKYREEPKYSNLIDRIAPSQVERRELLKKYIEPSNEERAQGLKVSSEAHKAIAQLVKMGNVRVILTTNIDQLLESALRDVGITPVVILNDDSLEGAMPYVHSECTIIKLHGDYMDTRIKNSPDELAQYSENMNTFLDRIFDEFGLVICGWSANWDVALRGALNRRKNHRFSTYWAYRNGLGEDASQLKDHLQAIPLLIEDADHFFQNLSENIDSLRTFERPHPLSIPLAIAQVKKYVAEDKYRIQLHDLVQDEMNKLCRDLNSDRFKTEGIAITNENRELEFQKLLHKYEETTHMGIGIFSTLVFFDNGASSKIISLNIERLIHKPHGNGNFLNLQWYPALLVSYSIGIAAIVSENYDALAALLLKFKVNDYGRMKSIPRILNVWEIFSEQTHKLVPIEDAKNRYTPANDYLLEILQNPLNHIIPDKQKFEESFNIFEYLLGLICIDLETPDLSSNRIWGLTGRFNWCYERIQSSEIPSPIDDFLQKGISQGTNWGLLKAGFFQGSPERFNACKSAFDRYLEDVRSRQWHLF